MKIQNLIPIAAAALILASVMMPSGCANTTTPPSGGPKDTIPPYITAISPMPGTTGVPTHNTRISFTFNEYVKVKEQSNIYLSPPLEKAPKYKIKGKSVVVYFENDLQPNTTYTLDITGAIVDNNEGNPFPGYTLVFSTGSQIDSFMVTGTVRDCNTLQPVKGATVMLYRSDADSAVFNARPDASAKTDDWGFFLIRNISDTLYRVYAVQDANNDNKYQMESERIAFLDSAFRPTTVYRDRLPEVLKYDMKDTARVMARRSELELHLFREKPSRQFIVKKERVGDRTAYITFMAPNAQINSMRIMGLPKEKLITQFNPQRDSLEIWVNDQRRMPDTLKLAINYMKTDTAGLLRATDEVIRLARDKKAKAAAAKSSRRDLKHDDTTCVFTGIAESETIEQYGFTLEFKYPLIESAFDSLQLRCVNPRQKESYGTFTVTRDTSNLRRYTVMPNDKLLPGWEYFLKVPHRRFRDINGFYNDSTVLKVSLPSDEKLSTMHLHLTGVTKRYIIDLLNEKRDKTIRSFVVDADGTVTFPYIRTGKYSVRITEDANGNGMVDTGSLLEHRQPEKVKFFMIGGNYQITIPERSELDQNINLKELFQ